MMTKLVESMQRDGATYAEQVAGYERKAAEAEARGDLQTAATYRALACAAELARDQETYIRDEHETVRQ